MVIPVFAFGEADGQPVDGAELRLNRLIQRDGHGALPAAAVAA
jgi:hypothetical protein